ncbi:MAG: hypothetical protein J3R72DRAFT_442448, partial [Linnemannia gamsii]
MAKPLTLSLFCTNALLDLPVVIPLVALLVDVVSLPKREAPLPLKEPMQGLAINHVCLAVSLLLNTGSMPIY